MKTWSERKNEYNRKWHEVRHLADPKFRLFKNARTRARIHGFEFSIEMDDIVIPMYCPILGLKLDPLNAYNSAPSLDRIDNSKGYTKGNTRVISAKANRMKTNASQNELVTFAKAMLRDLT